jgi:DNA invertase Pin-like site-specific DNA recombinase
LRLVTVADGLHLKPGKDDVVTSVLLFAFSLAAKLERAAINDRIAAARERLEAEGRPWGRPSRLTPADVNKIVALQAQGLSHRAIAVRVHVPRSTVTLALKRAASVAA